MDNKNFLKPFSQSLNSTIENRLGERFHTNTDEEDLTFINTEMTEEEVRI